jgi:hypothetical protein
MPGLVQCIQDIIFDEFITTSTLLPEQPEIICLAVGLVFVLEKFSRRELARAFLAVEAVLVP